MRHIIPIACIILFFIGSFSITVGCPIENRVLYIFSHGNILHLAINLYSFYVLNKSLRTKWIIPLVLFFGIVTSFAAFTPTVGLSGALFGLLGMCAVKYRYKLKQIGMILFTIAISAFMPHLSWSCHLLGFIVGYLTQFIYGRIYGHRCKANLQQV